MRLTGFLIAICAAGFCGCLEAKPPNRQSNDLQALHRIVVAKLGAAIIPKVQIENATVRETFDFWKKKCVELDAPVNVVLRLEVPGSPAVPPGAPQIPGLEPLPNPAAADLAAAGLEKPPLEPHIQFRGEHVSCLELLNVICRQAGLEWTVEKRWILVQPTGRRSTGYGRQP